MNDKIGIFNGFETGTDSYELYVKACEDLGVPYEVVDIISPNWIENVRRSGCAAFLVRPTPKYSVWKRMYDERLYCVVHTLCKTIYPSYDELFLYENKRAMAYFLQLHDIPHPATHIYYRETEAVEFARKTDYPIVFKTHIGAAASGVKILRNRRAAESLIRRVFHRGYIRKAKISLKGFLKHKIAVPYFFFDREYKTILLQEYIPVKAEWRMIRIGDSYFGHQKLKKGESHSGSGLVGWVRPPDSLLNFTKHICDTGKFNSMCLDIFEDQQGRYLVNELQTVFGSYDPSQMYIDGKPGRFTCDPSGMDWHFEEGYFNHNGSCNLRVQHLLHLLERINVS